MTQTPNKPKNILILQGDWEGGLCNVALDLQANGSEVCKVVFHAGDYAAYYKSGIKLVKFDKPIESFEDWLRTHIQSEKIDTLVIYNEYRPYNKIGHQLSRELNIQCLILEMGLLRPDYITIYTPEQNTFEYLQDLWENVLKDSHQPIESPPPHKLRRMQTANKIRQFAKYYILTRVSMKLGLFKHYVDQRTMSLDHHFRAGLRGTLRLQGRSKQSRFNKILANRWKERYYIVPLQVHCDSQITVRSKYTSIEEFIEEVTESFFKYAPAKTKLIFKVHPIDRGYADYRQFIQNLNAKFQSDRLLYLDKINNPIALTNALGCVTVNSSMGISSLINKTPVICLGEAAFDLPGLTHQGNLDTFWTDAEEVNTDNVKKFVSLLKETSQGHGTFYQKIYAVKGNAKIKWPSAFSYLFPKQ